MQAVFRRMLLLGLISLSACTVPQKPAATGLNGTSWTLVAYRPAGAGEIRPERADQYQLQFQADGRLAAQIDCNRGSGNWQTTPADAPQGGLRLGPLGLTRMMCPPGPLSARLPADLDAIESFRLTNGQLQLDLAGNTGSYLWQRAQP
ncbi:META domain-containing protein [Duganella sp. FT135W]|uniref:META domain-containing protein n=1 Tax=Duganella flavida TaxID=2692175 RepID=A0A6L8KDA2_9BURK|nr:META domain-containing protein [Duganella flavida]MYM24218.1 META domain-containing protein [Duganella flavida]